MTRDEEVIQSIEEKAFQGQQHTCDRPKLDVQLQGQAGKGPAGG